MIKLSRWFPTPVTRINTIQFHFSFETERLSTAIAVKLWLWKSAKPNRTVSNAVFRGTYRIRVYFAAIRTILSFQTSDESCRAQVLAHPCFLRGFYAFPDVTAPPDGIIILVRLGRNGQHPRGAENWIIIIIIVPGRGHQKSAPQIGP